MAEWHLKEIENALYKIGFTILPVEATENHWIIRRQFERQIDFLCNDHWGNPLSLEKAFACAVLDTTIDLYFYKKGIKWKTKLKSFIDELNKL